MVVLSIDRSINPHYITMNYSSDLTAHVKIGVKKEQVGVCGLV